MDPRDSNWILPASTSQQDQFHSEGAAHKTWRNGSRAVFLCLEGASNGSRRRHPHPCAAIYGLRGGPPCPLANSRKPFSDRLRLSLIPTPYSLIPTPYSQSLSPLPFPPKSKTATPADHNQPVWRALSHQDVTSSYARCRNSQYNSPESNAAAGSVKIHAAAMFRMVENCSPLLFAAIVPATPELSTCVVLTGSP